MNYIKLPKKWTITEIENRKIKNRLKNENL